MKRDNGLSHEQQRHSEYVQYGCGLCAPASWRNFDASPTLWLQRLPLFGYLFRSWLFGRRGYPVFPLNVEYGNIVKGLPIHPESCRAIYCSHVLEHLALDEFRAALANTYTYLKRDGVFRFVLPDLEQLVRNYMNSIDMDASIQFIEQLDLGRKTRSRGVLGFVRDWLGNSNHLWMWDYRSISSELKQVGFTEIRRAEFGDSKDMLFCDVEDFERWKGCLGVECIK